MRNGVRLALTVITGLVLSGAAQAKDVCVEQGTERLVFKKVKALKKPGTIVPLNGVYIETGGLGGVGVMSGTAFVRSDGEVVFGVYINGTYTAGVGLGYDITINMIGAPTFDADGYYVRNGALTSDSWTPIDCKDVVLP
jgi:hypothetical protein